MAEVPAQLSPLPGVSLDEPWRSIVGVPLQIIVTVVIAVVVRWVLHRLINRVVSTASRRRLAQLASLPGVAGAAGAVLATATGESSDRQAARLATLGAVLRSVVTIVVMGIAVLMVMQLVGLPLAPLLASAGVGGVAIGFGAQSLIKDFLSGIFMIVEDQYGVGDSIDLGAVSGTVEDVSLRVTRLRDVNGIVWYVRNGEILRVGNISQGWSLATVDVQVGYDADLEKVTAVLTEVAHSVAQEERWQGSLLEEPTVAGVEALGGGLVTVRMTAKCVAGQQFAVQRELREKVKDAFDAKGIRLPVPPPGPYAGGAPPS